MSEQNNLIKISNAIDNVFTPEQVGVIKSTVAKGTSDAELAYFLMHAHSVGLNPLNHEIWCFKIKEQGQKRLITFAGRDGFLKIAQRSSRWNGLVSMEVRKGDLEEGRFFMRVAEGEIYHNPDFHNRQSQEIIGAYCLVRPKDAEIATIVWVDFKRYNRRNYIWRNYPESMITKVAESHALKKAFGISALQIEYDWDINDQGYAEAHTIEKDELAPIKKKLIDALDKYQGEDKESIRKQCTNAIGLGQFTKEYAEEIAEKIGVDLEAS